MPLPPIVKPEQSSFRRISLSNLSGFNQCRFISSLKVVWRKDTHIDEAIEKDKRWRLCSRVVKEVLNEPGQVIPLRYLEKRRDRLRLTVKVQTFINRYPGLFEIYPDRIKPKSELVPFLRVDPRLRRFLEEEKRIRAENEPLVVAKLSKLLMMSKHKVVSADKLVHVKREFGFPDDFLCSLVPKYPELFRLVGCLGEEKSFLELVSWRPEFAKSAIELRAEEESRLTGIRTRPAFNVRLPSGFFLKKQMREWVRDWMELPYISLYSDATHLDQASPEMEKRTVGVFHVHCCEGFRFQSWGSSVKSTDFPMPSLISLLGTQEFSTWGLFDRPDKNPMTKVSLPTEGNKTAVLREAYKKSELIDKDPLHEIRDKFVEMLDEGHHEWLEAERLRRESVQGEMEQAAIRNADDQDWEEGSADYGFQEYQ